MKRITALTAAGGLAATALIAGASAQASSDKADPIGPISFSVTEHVQRSSFIDLNKGPVGDEYVFASRLTIGPDTVGHAHGVCTTTGRFISNCNVVATFMVTSMTKQLDLKGPADPNKFQVTVSGESVDSPIDQVFAVTGGTQLLYGVTGQVTMHPLSNNKDRLFFDMTTPFPT